MRARVSVALLALALAGAAAGALAAPAALPFKAVLKAPTHTPKANVKWWYSVRVTDLAGHAIRATVTVQIVDPLGTAHPVQYDATKINIVNRPFRGVFRDYVTWPPESRIVRLTFRVIVKAKGAKKVVNYWVKAR